MPHGKTGSRIPEGAPAKDGGHADMQSPATQSPAIKKMPRLANQAAV
jgi:hypothetical protein